MAARRILMTLIIFCSLVTMAAAQENVTVPDLTGLSVPAAAAALNNAGLALGAENNEGWTAESGLEQNRIQSQSVAAGTSVAPGTAVDITVLRSPNVILLYDDNDLTVVNNTGGELNLTGLVFNALDGSPASLAGTRWSDRLRANQCVQVWSIGRNGPKGLDECPLIQNWLVTTNAGEHFWTGGGGTTRFNVTQNGVERAQCAIANPGRCEFYLSAVSAADSTSYVYFAYTNDRLAIINRSTDQWMALSGFTVFNNFAATAGAPVPVGDPSLYGQRNINPVARVGQLAPGQCVLFTSGVLEAPEPPQGCAVIANLAVDPTLIFWGAAFDMDSSDGQRRSCPAAVVDKLTICVMPR